mgnify:CR=1 FL=1
MYILLYVDFFVWACSVNELLKMKDDLTKERDEKLSDIAKLRDELAQSTSRQQKAEHDREEAEMKIAEVCKFIFLLRYL